MNICVILSLGKYLVATRFLCDQMQFTYVFFRISHFIEVETELERLNYQLKQKDRKSDGFLKTIEEKDQEIVQLENR